MNHWRVTKYNPKYRNRKGIYTKQEWIDISDIGKIFQGKKLTLEEYLKTEMAYIFAIKNFWQASNITFLEVANLELYAIEDLSYEGVDLAIPHIYNKYAQLDQNQSIYFSDV